MVERRKNKRFPSKLLITTVYRDEMNKVIMDDSIFTEDIGIGGMRLAFPRPLPRGKILDLKVFLFADPIHLPAQGRVIWSNKKQGLELVAANKSDKDKQKNELFWVGIQFVNIDAFTQDRILQWIKKEFNTDEA